jgi:hypothetical protein
VDKTLQDKTLQLTLNINADTSGLNKSLAGVGAGVKRIKVPVDLEASVKGYPEIFASGWMGLVTTLDGLRLATSTKREYKLTSVALLQTNSPIESPKRLGLLLKMRFARVLKAIFLGPLGG